MGSTGASVFEVLRDAGRHRVEAEGLGVSLGALAGLAQNEEPAASAVKREEEEDWGK